MIRKDPLLIRKDPLLIRKDPLLIRKDPLLIRKDPLLIRKDPASPAVPAKNDILPPLPEAPREFGGKTGREYLSLGFADGVTDPGDRKGHSPGI